MKKILYNYTPQLFFLAVTFMLLQACENDEVNSPVITGIINYAPSPDDTVLQSLTPGQWVVVTGHNLQDALQISFNGISASFNSGLFSDTYAVVQVPSVIPFPSIPAEKLNTIQYITSHGAATFEFNIVAPAPIITRISNENANPGDSVYIYGTNLFLLTKISFAGVPITSYTSSVNGTSVGFVLPELSQSGPVVVANQSGGDSTVYNVNDVTGVLCDFDDINTMSWGTGTNNSSADFPGNKGYYAVLKNSILSGGDEVWWNWERSINTNAVQWVPVSSLNEPVGNYAFKFEINVPDAWKGTSIVILKDYTWTYVAPYEPWKDANGDTFSYSTNGWLTVTIPLSEFRKDKGTGLAVTSLTDLLGSTGNGSVNIYTINTSASSPTATGLTAAIDNIRVVKIK